MDAARIPLDIQAPISPQALGDLARMLSNLGYEPRTSGSDPGGGAEVRLRVGESIAPEAANVLLEGVSNWIRQQPVQRGRFRHRRPKPVTVTIHGPSETVLARSVVERG